MKELDQIILVLCVLLGIYLAVLGLIASDLWSGLRKAKVRGEIRSSYGLKKTVEKIAKYYNMLFAVTLVDCIHMVLIWYLDIYHNYSIPIIPILTAVGAIFIGIIEIKSIYEKADEKVKFEQAGQLAAKIISSKDDLKEIVKAIAEYMKDNKVETKKEKAK